MTHLLGRAAGISPADRLSLTDPKIAFSLKVVNGGGSRALGWIRRGEPRKSFREIQRRLDPLFDHHRLDPSYSRPQGRINRRAASAGSDGLSFVHALV